MKSTGIVRRIDDLGRVCIPKEIRRAARIKYGDPLEIFVTEDGVLFRKYDTVSIMDNINTIFAQLDEFSSREDAPLAELNELRAALRKVDNWLARQ